ncbi:MAG: hypothetical protein M5U28_11140 [Sandaracinaceae bacterium]|nr:hypothetical protein [Sandaracinaceae bacterium]
MLNDLRGKAVVITGGTMGIGLATGLAFGREGASVTLTHKWGSADEDEIRALFREAGAPEPRIVQADAGNDDDTLELLEALKARSRRHPRGDRQRQLRAGRARPRGVRAAVAPQERRLQRVAHVRVRQARQGRVRPVAAPHRGPLERRPRLLLQRTTTSSRRARP